MSVLSARRISVSFGGVHAVVDVDLEVGPGELVGLIGPNGAGKTTFIDAVTGFVPHRGTVELDGSDITGLSPHARARRGLARTWQAIELFDDLSVRENLTVAAHHPSMRTTLKELFARPLGRSRAVDEALEVFALGDLADVMPSELTQGQRKLVAVARALAARPQAAVPRRAGCRPRRQRVDRLRPPAARDRRPGHPDPARRPRHGTRARDLRSGRGARVRQGDRRGTPEEVPRRPEGGHRLPGLGRQRDGSGSAGDAR